MTTKSKYFNRVLSFFDDAQNFETVERMAPIGYADDFLGAGRVAFPTTQTQGVDWGKKTQQTGGTPTVVGVAAAGGGVARAALDATSEKQEASLYWVDQKGLDITKGLIVEARVKLSVLPTGAVQAVWGIADSWIDGPDNNTHYLQFGATGNGAILARSQDGTTQTSAAVSSALVVVNTDWHIFKIDAGDVTKVRYSIDGVDVTPAAGVAFAATGASAILQPYFSVYKASGTGLGSIDVDYFRAWVNR